MKIEGANWYWVYWAKSDPYNDENTVNFRWSDAKEGDEQYFIG